MSLKLFGNTGTRFTDKSGRMLSAPTMARLIAWGKKASAITFTDVLKAAAVVVFGTAVAVLIFADAKAEVGQGTPARGVPTAEGELAADEGGRTQFAPTGEDTCEGDSAEVVSVDYTEALAQGIDAVISSEVKSDIVSDATLLMVGNVILNRTEDSRYPDTVDQVLMQPYQFSCFSTTGMKWVGRAADDMYFRQRCMDAAECVMSGERMLNYSVVYVSSVKQGSVEAQLDGLYFCK